MDMAANAHQPQQLLGKPIISRYADDPHMRDSIRFFTAEFKRCISAIQQALDDHDWQMVRQIALQLHGAAGSYGYPEVTSAAAEIIDQMRDPQPESQTLTLKLDALVSLANRVIAGCDGLS
jgi:HPt (histidine-containing phosphotransfer) domain-containing protein